MVDGVLLEPGANLSGKKLSNLDLSGVDLSGANLRESVFSWSNLQNAKLDGADLSGANFYGSDLTGASLKSAVITGAMFLTAKLQNANLNDSRAFGSQNQATDALFGSADLTGASLEGVKYEGINFENANLTNARLVSSSLRWIRFDGATLTNADFLGSEFIGQISGKIGGTPKDLPAKWTTRSDYLFGPGASYAFADLRNLDLSKLDLGGANFRYAKLNNANLSNSTLKGAYLTGANFSGANFEGIRSGEVEWQTNGCCPGTLPENFRVSSGFLVGPKADLSNENLNGLILTGMPDARGANFSGSSLIDSDFYASNLRDANFSGANLMGSNFDESNLDGANFSLANITDARFYRATLENVNLLGATDLHRSESISRDYSLVEGIYFGSLETLEVQATLSKAKVGEASTAIVLGLPAGTNVEVFWEIDGTAAQNSSETFYPEPKDFGRELSARLVFSKLGYVSRDFRTDPLKVAAGTLSLNPTPTVSGTSKVGQTLTASAGSWDPGVTLTYQWLRDGVAIAAANKNTLQLTTDDNSKLITVEVTATKTGYATVKKTSTAVKVEPGTQTVAPTPTVSGTSKVGQTLTASAGSWDPGVTLTYQWLRDGVSISGAASESYVLTPGDVGRIVAVRVTGTLAGYVTAAKLSAKVIVATGSMTITTPKVTGTGKSGSTLKATTSAWVKGSKITYQWLSNGAVIKGATSSSFMLTTAYKGKKISVKVTQAATGYTTAVKTSNSVTVSK